MAVHKFSVGQTVRLSPQRYGESSVAGSHTIVRRLPEQGDTPQYRIKAEVDGRERVVLEHQLVRS